MTRASAPRTGAISDFDLFGIADNRKARARRRRSLHRLRGDAASILQHGFLAAGQPRPQRFLRHAERGKPVGAQMRARNPLEAIAEACGPAMADRKTADAIPVRGGRRRVDLLAGRELDKAQRHRRAALRPQAGEIALDKAKRFAAAKDRQLAPPADEAEGGDQPAQTEHMVEIGMGQQDVAEPAKPGPGAQHLARRALAAIDEEPRAAGADEQRRQTAFA